MKKTSKDDSRQNGRTGAQALVESLERAGAEVVFGYPGGNIVDVFDHIRTAKFRFVLGRHEQGCVHMADGYARATGRPGVAIVTSGPGATNAITGLATANVDGVPLVLVSGQVPLSQIGTDAFQEADMTGICRAATKHSFLVKSADEIPETVAEAFYIATHGKPGAVVIDVPKNVQEETTSARYPERVSLRAYHPDHAATPSQVGRLARWLNEAKRPVIFAGGGVIAANAAQDVAALAKKAGIPVATTLMGIGSVDCGCPHSLGMAGIYGSYAANAALAAADLLIALGVRFSDRVTCRLPSGARRARIVHVDCDPSSIDKNVAADLGIVADVKDLLTTVNSRVKPQSRADWLARTARWKADHPFSYRQIHKNVIMPQSVVEALDRAADGRTILAADVGQNQMWCAQYFRHSRPRRFLTSGGMGTMGFALPAAIGAAIARPDCRVVAVAGDGGAQMTIEELAAAVAERLPIVLVVLNNCGLGMVRQMQAESFGGRYCAVDFPPVGAGTPDFVKLARAYGAAGVRVTDPAKLEAAIARAMRARRTTLVEVAVEPEANA